MKRCKIYGESPSGAAGWLYYSDNGVIYPEQFKSASIFRRKDADYEISILKRIGWKNVRTKRVRGRDASQSGPKYPGVSLRK